MRTMFVKLCVVLCMTLLVSACGGAEDGSDPTATLDPDAAVRADAERYCPEEYLEPCMDAYITFAKGDKPAALCVNPQTSQWTLETPNGDVGEKCTNGETILVIVGGD